MSFEIVRGTTGAHMKNSLALFASLLALTGGAFAQSYSIDWFTIDGGGGTSTGGVYSVSGTIGQPDAGALAGGSYSIAGGFWGGIVAVQTAGAPSLYITNLLDGTAKISWAPSTPGFVVQQ